MVPETLPDTSHRQQPLPGDRLPVEPDDAAAYIRREGFPVEQAGAAPALHLTREAGERERRRFLVEERRVPGEPVVLRSREQHGPRAPAREPGRQPPEREAENRFRDVRVAVAGHHPSGVERLGERELLVGVADAIAPGEDPLLDEQAPLGVQHAPLRNVERGATRELAFPEALRRSQGEVVGGGADVERAPTRAVHPGDVEHSGTTDAVAGSALVEHALPVGHEPGAASAGRGETDDRGRAPRATRVDGQAHEAHERADAGYPPGERFLGVAHPARVDIARPEDGQPAVCPPRPAEAREAGAVDLAPVADEDRQAGAVDAAREDRAPVGDMECERLLAVEAERVREREVVRAGAGQRRPAAAPARTKAAEAASAPLRSSVPRASRAAAGRGRPAPPRARPGARRARRP